MTNFTLASALPVLLLYFYLPLFTIASRIETTRIHAKELPGTDETKSFSFIIFGDRTQGIKVGLKILRKAVQETNVIGPDFVMTVGDLVQGYNGTPGWVEQMKEFRAIVDQLNMPWFPVAGNHDIYWRGPNKPAGGHIKNFEKYFGPAWYHFIHKDCLFVVLFTDEGDPITGEQTYLKPKAQIMSKAQKKWLRATLDDFGKNVDHIFIFLHYPRWEGRRYGDDWEKIHAILKESKKVSAVFAGHNHYMRYDGEKDGIKYFVVGATGGEIEGHYPEGGRLQHYSLVTVRGSEFHMAVVPVGAILDPEKIVNKFPKIRDPKLLVPVTPFFIKSDISRTLTYPVVVPNENNKEILLIIEVSHSFDDSGDKGMTYRLLDDKGELVKSGKMNTQGWYKINQTIESNKEYLFLLEDLDTKIYGKNAGNGGKIKIRWNNLR